MSESIRTILLIISTVLVVTSTIPYLMDIVKNKTKPRVVSWFNWALLGAIAGAAAWSAGQIPAAVISFASATESLLIVSLGLYYGDRRVERFDVACQIGAIIGLILWLVFNSPLTAIIAVTAIDMIAALPTYKHIWQKPFEETLLAFGICSFASVLTLFTITNASLSGLIYPIYILLVNSGMAGLIMYRRPRVLQVA